MIYDMILNLLSFILYFFFYKRIKEEKSIMKYFFLLLCLLKGSLGILLASLFLKNKENNKDTIMVRLFALCIFIIQILLCFSSSLFQSKEVWINPIDFFIKYPSFLYYYLIINILTFLLFGIDKYNAINHKRRISIKTLLFFSFIGGALFAIGGMYIFKHKTKKDYFKIGLPLIVIIHYLCMGIIMNIYKR